ncbi:hypothetical protein SGRI78S_06485 [Streptomyces griseus subsp. griseus]
MRMRLVAQDWPTPMELVAETVWVPQSGFGAALGFGFGDALGFSAGALVRGAGVGAAGAGGTGAAFGGAVLFGFVGDGLGFTAT